MRLAMPIILIVLALGIFFIFASPLIDGISEIRAQASSYNEALTNSKALENERDKLTAKQNSIDPNNLRRLERFLPENVDNIRLILEIEQIAAPYGMTLKDVKYDTEDEGGAEGDPARTGVFQAARTDSGDYGTFELQFSTSGRYGDFVNFTRDLENNLRMVDISSIKFSSDGVNIVEGRAEPSNVYKYDFTIKTYWLKN